LRYDQGQHEQVQGDVGRPIDTSPPDRMQLKTILNRVEKHRSFVYGEVRLYEREARPVLDT
jgi:hypothetical protein